MTLAADLAAASRPTGDATLVERETGAPGHASINVWDLYTDDGRYFFSQTEAGLSAQVKENNNQGGGQFGREVAAAIYAVTGDLDTTALKMIICAKIMLAYAYSINLRRSTPPHLIEGASFVAIDLAWFSLTKLSALFAYGYCAIVLNCRRVSAKHS